MTYAPMISEKKMIFIDCHKDIIIRNSAGDVLFPNKQEISLKQQVTRNSTISCTKKISYITIRYLECN